MQYENARGHNFSFYLVIFQTILLQDRLGKNYCVACSELDSDTDKDNPGMCSTGGANVFLVYNSVANFIACSGEDNEDSQLL